MSRVDPAKQATVSRAMKPLMEELIRRGGLPAKDPRQLRWVGTLLPNDAAAQDAEMGILDYEEFVYRAGKLDQKDPVAAWKKLGASQQRLADRLERAREMHITTQEGTDIRFGIKGRRWINGDGKKNFPDGEVFTGPVEDATEGVVKYSFPAVHGGREVRDIMLRFKAGRVVDACASHNEDFLVKMLDQDKGARVLGELALGTNYSIKDCTKNTLFDEKIGGTFHAALGAAPPESGGTNKSGLHWDMVCDLRKGGIVRVDGAVISKNGRFADARWPR
jgi:aminopeptidase